MELILHVFAFLRPMLAMDATSFLGDRFFTAVGAGFIGLLFVAICVHLAVKKRLVLSAIDLAILFYVGWCVAGLIIYPHKTVTGEFVKWVAAPLTYVVAKAIVRDREQYLRLLRTVIAGFSIPVAVSAVMIAAGYGLEQVNYWTGLARYQGAFANPHNMAHAMGLVVMTVFIYLGLCRDWRGQNAGQACSRKSFLWSLVVILALYCLYYSYVRTVIVGLLIFAAFFLFYYSKKMLVTLVAVLAVGVLVFSPVVSLIFHDVVGVVEGDRTAERIGSGRPYIWGHNLSEFSELSLDRQILGAGIGNTRPMYWIEPGGENFWNSHNDYLDVLMQTGVVGLGIFLFIQLALLWRILNLRGFDRYVFLAFFVATGAMNLVSNSLIARFALAQIYFLILIYPEVAARMAAAKPVDRKRTVTVTPGRPLRQRL